MHASSVADAKADLQVAYNEMRDTDIAVAFEHTTHVNSTNQWGTLNKVLSMNYYRDDLCFKSASKILQK